jgi:uncharacterized protein YjbI with pentapeptide repeats
MAPETAKNIELQMRSAPLKTENICNPALLGANFSRANLKDADLEGIELKQIVLCQTMMPKGNVSNSNCSSDLKNSLKTSGGN